MDAILNLRTIHYGNLATITPFNPPVPNVYILPFNPSVLNVYILYG
jgi:hypothetical protein